MLTALAILILFIAFCVVINLFLPEEGFVEIVVLLGMILFLLAIIIGFGLSVCWAFNYLFVQ